jgi:hypothetical protein
MTCRNRHTGGRAGGELLANLDRYRIAAVQVAAWLVLAAVVAAGSVLLLRGRAGRRSGWALAALGLRGNHLTRRAPGSLVTPVRRS